ncbi:MAG: hypothetical protein EA356_06420 [Geminicoccaceae bacterium]|nr:MAG: hypothetical protein EA356_06420 [Geminicoccaceae bacterium]
MAYDPVGLSALSYANGFTLWHYRSADRAEEVDGLGYFDPAARLLRIGDFIFLNVATQDEPEHLIRVVATNDGSRVAVQSPGPHGRGWRE